MNKVINEISELVFYKMEDYNQITLDLVSDAEDMLTEDTISKEQIGAMCYTISIILEVIDPNLINDVNVLNRLKKELKLIHDEIV